MADEATESAMKAWRAEIEAMHTAGARFVVLAGLDLIGKLEIIYLFQHEGQLKEVKLQVPYDVQFPSITDLFPSANFVERETVDLLGAKIEGAAPFLELTEGSGIVAPLRKNAVNPRPSGKPVAPPAAPAAPAEAPKEAR
jgi:NADH:ubiquinone oxidoreductase subunit C